MPAQAPSFIASGNISPSRFVMIDTTSTKNFHVSQATAGTDRPIGISQDGTRQPPGVIGSDAFAAHVGETLTVFGEGEIALLTVGTGGCTQGDYLKSDASGQGVTVAFTPAGVPPVFHGAIALEAALAGELARVLVKVGPVATTA